MRNHRRAGRAALLWVACLMAGCGTRDSGTTPDPPPTPAPPAPIVLREGAIFIRSAGSTGGAKFSTPAAGRVQLNMNWTPTGAETDLFVRVLWRSYQGECAPTCEAEDLCASHCRRQLVSWTGVTTRSVTLSTEEILPADNYELWVSYYDPLDYLIPLFPGSPPRVSVSYQVILLPAAR